MRLYLGGVAQKRHQSNGDSSSRTKTIHTRYKAASDRIQTQQSKHLLILPVNEYKQEAQPGRRRAKPHQPLKILPAAATHQRQTKRTGKQPASRLSYIYTYKPTRS